MSYRPTYRTPGAAIPDVLAMAAAEPRFAEALLDQREEALDACGFALTAAERATLIRASPARLRQMIDAVAPRLDDADRRRFLGLAGVALAALLGGAAGCGRKGSGPTPKEPVASAPARDAASRAPPAPRIAEPLPPPGHGNGGYGLGTGSRPDSAPRPGPVVFMSKATVKGGLDPDTVRRVIRRHLQEINACYQTTLTSAPRTEGIVTMAFVIGLNGQVEKERIARDTTGQAPLGQCMLAAVKTWRFPRPDPKEGPVTVEYPFVFKITS